MKSEKPRVRESSRFAAFLYSFVLQAGYNYEGFQHLGFSAAMRPALKDLYPEPGDYARVAAEHLEYFNANPFTAPFALGSLIRLEEQRAAASEGAPDPEQIARARRSLGSMLGSLGDGIFWAGILPAAALAGMLAWLLSPLHGALVLLLAFNVPQLITRAEGMRIGYYQGMEVASGLAGPRGHAAMRWIRRMGALLAGLLIPFACVYPPAASTAESAAILVASGLAGWALLHTPLRRVLALLLVAALISLYALLR